MDKEKERQIAIELVNAYFDGKRIVMKDPLHGVREWVSIEGMGYWSYLGNFCKNLDKYRIIDKEETR